MQGSKQSVGIQLKVEYLAIKTTSFVHGFPFGCLAQRTVMLISWYPETHNNPHSYENNILLGKEKAWVYMYVIIKFKHLSWLL